MKIFADGDITRTAHQREILAAMLDKVEKSVGFGRLNIVDRLAGCVTTDMDSKSVRKVIGELHGMDIGTNVYSAIAPAKSQVISKATYSVIDSSAWQTMMGRVGDGMTPSDSATGVTGTDVVAASSYTVDIQNGSG